MNDNKRFDFAAYERRIDDERRAFRRARRLDLKWAGVAYAVAVLCGACIAFDPDVRELTAMWLGVAGLSFASVGHGRLEAHFEGLER